MVGCLIMGLSWWKPDTETVRGFYKFMPRIFREVPPITNNAEIKQLEDILLGDKSASQLSNASELIRLRELQKDRILYDLNLCANQALNENTSLRCPPTTKLIQPHVTDIIVRLFNVRTKLLTKLEK